MHYQEFPTPAHLKDHIQLIWSMASETAEDRFARERILPDGIVELVFHFAGPFRTTRADGSSYIQESAFAISQMREYIEIESTGAVGFMAVRFYPWGAHHFFATPISSFLDDAIPAIALWPQHATELASLTARTGDWEGRLNSLETFLAERYEENRSDDVELDEAIRRIRNSGGQLALSDLCQDLAISEKQLQRKFLPAVGIPPKAFSRVSRFLDICKRMSEFRDKTLAELAHHCGYFDQAHFNREFKQFSGFTPKEFFRRDDIGYADL